MNPEAFGGTMKTPAVVPPCPTPLTLLSRRLLLALLVGSTWSAAAWFLGNRGEAFWLLFPVWVLAGIFIFHAIPAPRAQYKRPLAKWSVQTVVILFPIGYCYAMASFMGAAVSWKEILIAVWFFAVSLEILLLYLFQVFDDLCLRLSRKRDRGGRVAALIGTKLLLYGLLVPFLVSTFALHRVKFPSRPLPPDLGMAFEEVRFPARGEPRMNLAGWFFPLENNQGTVLACHGVGANRADILEIICILQDAGFQVLCFDFRGHGESDGHSVTYGFRERQDVQGAWDYLMTRRDVDPDRIFGFGISMGASSLLMALPELPGMKAVVADSAFSSLNRMMHHQYRLVPGPLAEIPVALTRIFGWLDTGLRVEHADVAAAIRRLNVPIFFIHGLDDVSVPPDCTRLLFDSYGGPKKLRLAPGAGHGGTAGLDTGQYQRELHAFFLEHARDSNHVSSHRQMPVSRD